MGGYINLRELAETMRKMRECGLGVYIEPAAPVTIESLQAKLAEQSATIARLEAEVARLTPKKRESDAFPAAALSQRKRQIGLRTGDD